MKITRRLLLAVTAALPFAAWAAPYTKPTQEVRTWRSEWRDARGFRGDRSHDAIFHPLIQQSTLAFWDACLRGDAKAKAWLHSEFVKESGDNGTFEQKIARTEP